MASRHDGHSLGLHAPANAANELAARLTAESSGAGTSARFTLVLPVESRRW